jgi:hypothetical protein
LLCLLTRRRGQRRRRISPAWPALLLWGRLLLRGSLPLLLLRLLLGSVRLLRWLGRLGEEAVLLGREAGRVCHLSVRERTVVSSLMGESGDLFRDRCFSTQIIVGLSGARNVFWGAEKAAWL